MKNNSKDKEQCFLKNKANKFYAIAFGLMTATCLVAIPLFNIANACGSTILTIASGASTAVLSIGSIASAAVADKIDKNKKEERENEL